MPCCRLYSTYTYTAAALERLKDPSNQKLHEQVVRAVTAYKDCLKTLPVRVCVYNRTLTKLHPVSACFQRYLGFFWVVVYLCCCCCVVVVVYLSCCCCVVVVYLSCCCCVFVVYLYCCCCCCVFVVYLSR